MKAGGPYDLPQQANGSCRTAHRLGTSKEERIVSIVYRTRSEDRATFIKTVFERLEVRKEASGKSILLKPNIVSHEPYPTTTHPETIETCVQLLSGIGKKLIVADGPAWDAGDSASVIDGHPLKKTCDALGVTIADLIGEGSRKVKTRSYELAVSEMAFEYDYIISLPVLKSHGMGLTGALKNQFGFVQSEEKLRSHRVRDMNAVIAEINEVFRPSLYIVDAVQTMVVTNEVRHGGEPHDLGYLLAGTDPVSLDAAGLELLKEVEPKLDGKRLEDIHHVKHAAGLGVGEERYEIVEV